MSRHSKGSLLRWLQGSAGVPWGADPGDYDATRVARTVARLGAIFGEEGGRRRYFSVEVEGWEHVAPSPSMVVCNHSGGTTVLDTIGFLIAWYRRFGPGRPIHPLAHEVLVSTKLVGAYLAAHGALRASRSLARRALSELGHDLMVMPGGDVEAWRPWSRRYQVDFAGRTGYARLAIEAGVPITPVAHAGAHQSFMVLTDGRRLVRWLHLARLTRSQIWPVHLSLPWGLSFLPLPHLPLPVRLRYRIGASIAPPPLPPDGRATEAQVRVLDETVRAAIQAMLDELAGRPRGRVPGVEPPGSAPGSLRVLGDEPVDEGDAPVAALRQ